MGDNERRFLLEQFSPPPTKADIIAYLQAHPDLAVEVVDGLKVARAWERGQDHLGLVETWGRNDLHWRELVTAWGDGMWDDRHSSHVSGQALEGARAAADAALAAAGWALAGGSRG